MKMLFGVFLAVTGAFTAFNMASHDLGHLAVLTSFIAAFIAGALVAVSAFERR